jgi:hypothetical protein
MVNKDVQANLRKYKLAIGGKTPSRGIRSASKGADSEGAVSPQVRFEGEKSGSSLGGKNENESLSSNRAIRQFLKDLDRGIGDKMSLLKMLVIKCDEADQNFNRLRNAINFGEIESADR